MAHRRGSAPAPKGNRPAKGSKPDPFAGAKVWTWEEIEALKGTWPDHRTAEELIAELRLCRQRIV